MLVQPEFLQNKYEKFVTDVSETERILSLHLHYIEGFSEAVKTVESGDSLTRQHLVSLIEQTTTAFGGLVNAVTRLTGYLELLEFSQQNEKEPFHG